ncbi:MAG TPA: CotS family spore coat protein [Clostridiales bacterium]|nr:CotS family spore coat protein [Clostridiales bacterium]
MYDVIDSIIVSKYGLKIKSSIPFREGFILATSKGRFLCKETRMKAGRILFVHSAKEHLVNNGFKNLDRYLCTQEGEPYVINNGKCYIVSYIIEGKECDFENRNDVKRASNLLACMHAASKGYIPPAGSLIRDDVGKTPSLFCKRLKEIKRMEKIASRRKSNFDYIYAAYSNYFYEVGKDALDYILSPIYDKLVNETRLEKIFCHNDLTYSNLILNDNRDSLINFDFCCYDLKVYDLANLIRRRMRRCNWDIREAKVITDEYNSVNKLTPEDFYVMKIMLQFPQKFWRVANKYYNSRRSWAERALTDRLEDVINEIDCHKKFLDNYEIII